MELNPLKTLIRVGELMGLSIIAIATFVAAGGDVWTMITNRQVHLADLLMLFIYLEVLAMVGIYLKSGKLPIRLPIYIAIVALARYLILEIHEMDWYKILVVSSGIVLLAVTTVVLRYGSSRFPMEIENEYQSERLMKTPSQNNRRRNNRRPANKNNASSENAQE